MRVSPKMTKTEIKEYLSKIYNVTATKISTTLFLGKWKRFFGKRRVIAYKRRNEKKAKVEFIDESK
jgi:large subunit ribosomal protein L23